MIENILLATDGSVPAQRAVDFAASLALRFRARVTVLSAATPVPQPNGGRDNPPAHESVNDSQALVDQTRQRLHEMGVSDVEATVVEGPAANVILGVAESFQPDLIVIGARGSGTWQGHILGSVSMAVTQRAECPVLVVR